MTHLLDSTVLIDVLNDRNGRPQFLAQLSDQDIVLACCAVNVTEIYNGHAPRRASQDGGASAQP
jgi:hypothetical protein